MHQGQPILGPYINTNDFVIRISCVSAPSLGGDRAAAPGAVAVRGVLAVAILTFSYAFATNLQTSNHPFKYRFYSHVIQALIEILKYNIASNIGIVFLFRQLA